MDKIIYTVLDISGEYVILIDSDGEKNPVAMALMPIEIAIGDVVEYADLTYSIK